MNGKADEKKIVTSKELHEEMNRELKNSGKSGVAAINTIGGVSTNNLARRDHSWNSVPDFFIQLIKRKGGNNGVSAKGLVAIGIIIALFIALVVWLAV